MGNNQRPEILVQYVASRIDYYERGRRSFMQIGLGMIAVSIAIMGHAGSSAALTGQHALVKLAVYLSGVVMLASGMILVYLYTQRTSPRYLPAGRESIVEWHYEPVLRPASDAKNYKEMYELALASYDKKLIKARTSQSVDTEHLFILHLVRSYKKDCVTGMKKVLKGALVVEIIVVLAGTCLYLAM